MSCSSWESSTISRTPSTILETLSKSARYCFINTKVTRWSGPEPSGHKRSLWRSGGRDDRQLLEPLPVAYLLGPDECNNDPSNYWVFSEGGLRRILQRTGWDVCDLKIFGNVENSDPYTKPGNARACCLAKSRNLA